MKSATWRILFGLVAILFGAIAIAVPGITARAFAFAFGFFMIIGGLFLLVMGIFGQHLRQRRWLVLIEGFVSLIIGLIAIYSPDITLVALLYLVAAWILIWGILELIVGTGTTAQLSGVFGRLGRPLLLASGILSIIVALLLFAFPGQGVLAVVWVIGVYAVIIGMINLLGGIFAETSPAM